MHTLLIKRYKDLNIYQPNLMASKVRFSPFTSCMNQPMSDLTKYLIEFLFVSLLCSRGIKIIYFKPRSKTISSFCYLPLFDYFTAS